MRISFSLVLFLLLGVARGAPLERDLGDRLIYYRTANVPADLPVAAKPERRSYVLDVRYAQGDAAGGRALKTWVQSHASPQTPVFVLVNGETNAALLSALAPHDPASGILLVGSAARGLVPDIALKISPDIERRAYEELESNPDVNAVLKDNTPKVRNDEARLSREHLPDSAVEDTPVASNPEPNDKSSPPKPAPPIDLALQRAVQLHRTLLALKKI